MKRIVEVTTRAIGVRMRMSVPNQMIEDASRFRMPEISCAKLGRCPFEGAPFMINSKNPKVMMPMLTIIPTVRTRPSLS